MNQRSITIDLGERKEGAPRRFPCTISSEAPVVRRDPYSGEQYEEVLSHKPGAVDLSRAPLPVLEGHDRSRVNIGIVENLRVEGSRLRGEIVFGASARAKELEADVAAGVVRNLSVGYSIEKEQRDEKRKRLTATRWTPYETSIVSVPADATVGIGRSHTVPEQTQTQQQTQTTPAADEATRAVAAERERVIGIRSSVRAAHLDERLADAMIAEGTRLERARELILERLAELDRETHIDSHIRVGDGLIVPGEDTTRDFQAAAVDSLLLRAGIRVEKPHAGARDVSASVYDIARICLSRAGKSTSRMFGGEARGPELIERAATTSDFRLVLSGALRAALRNGYESEPSSHRAWVRAVPVADFREQFRPILGSAPELEQVNEGGEYTHGAMDDDAASYRVTKFGRIVALTWETLVNDNLGAFLRVQPALGQAARRKEADLVYGLFGENAGAGPTMQDGVPLFDAAAHGNVAPMAALTGEALGPARTLLRRQQAVGGGYLALVPKFLIVPAGFETIAEMLLADAGRSVTTEKETPEWLAQLQLVVEPRLPDTSVYLAADSSQIDTCEIGLLEENLSGPAITEEEEFVRDVKRWKIRHVAGVKFLDWRGVVQLPVVPPQPE